MLAATLFTLVRLSRHSRIAAVFGVLMCGWVDAAEAQRTLVVHDPPTSRGIELTRLVTLRPPAGEAPFILPFTAVQDRRGTIYILDVKNTKPVWAFEASGRPIAGITNELALMRSGIVRGLAVSPPDTLVVISNDVLVVDGTGKIARRTPLPDDASVYGALSLPSGEVVLQAIVPTPDAFGYPLHITNSKGIVRSFGAETNDAFDGHPTRVLGSLAHAGADRFWSNVVRQYRINLWTSTGELLRVIDRKTSWFQPWTGWDGRIDWSPPPPRLVSTWQKRDGTLLTLSLVAARNWAPVVGRDANHEAPPPSAAQFERAHDSIIEAIDSRNGAVIGRQHVRGTLLAFLSDSVVVGLSSDARDGVGVDVWKVRLNPRKAR